MDDHVTHDGNGDGESGDDGNDDRPTAEIVVWPGKTTPPHVLDMRTPPDPRGVAELLAEGALMLPGLVMLIGRLLADRRVPLRRKLLVGAAVAYLVSPIDIVPDFVPVLGQADDLVLAAYAVHRLISSVPPDVQQAYWVGSEDTFAIVTSLVAWGADMLPRPVRRFLGDD